MAHYALLDENNIVVNVIVGEEEGHQNKDWEKEYSEIYGLRCLRTSYNTFQGKHTIRGKPFRGNYAGLNFFYSEALDAFIPPQPHRSWVLDESIYDWQPPVPYPTDGYRYVWDETQTEWKIDPDWYTDNNV